jgi:catechol 2,3-dioxygenase-like lactoylglutathione lyase family enzyme
LFTIFIFHCTNPPKQEQEDENTVIGDDSEFPSGSIQIGVITRDLERSVDFYTNVIGMIKTGGFSVDEAFAERSGLTGGIPFEVTVLKLKDSPDAAEWKLMSFGKEPTHSPQKFIQDDIGMQYITIFVKSMKPIFERLEKHNVTPLEETPTFLEDGRQFVLVQDPDGNFIELIGPAE